jgi:hypothetical protein
MCTFSSTSVYYKNIQIWNMDFLVIILNDLLVFGHCNFYHATLTRPRGSLIWRTTLTTGMGIWVTSWNSCLFDHRFKTTLWKCINHSLILKSYHIIVNMKSCAGIVEIYNPLSSEWLRPHQCVFCTFIVSTLYRFISVT